jgi:hypothetical protein
MRRHSLEDLSSARPPSVARRSSRGEVIGLCAVILMLFVAADLWDRSTSPAYAARAAAAVADAGYFPTEVRRHRGAICGRGSRGFKWKSAHAQGRVCVGLGRTPRVKVYDRF